ncbi:MAG: isoaspartyl peptidase/L-asparaginase, partial [Bacteroidota bacterium]
IDKKFGTVGAVAFDKMGNLAAATSTGGMTNKRFGRIGDTPIIGAGTYANNKTCAVSCTGHGEFFIRSVVAYDISCLMEYKNYSLKQACEFVVQDKLKNLGGEGGLIAVDANGNIEMVFNSEGMYRASIMDDKMVVEIY